MLLKNDTLFFTCFRREKAAGRRKGGVGETETWDKGRMKLLAASRELSTGTSRIP
jgi:hypothetical protein